MLCHDDAFQGVLVLIIMSSVPYDYCKGNRDREQGYTKQKQITNSSRQHRAYRTSGKSSKPVHNKGYNKIMMVDKAVLSIKSEIISELDLLQFHIQSENLATP